MAAVGIKKQFTKFQVLSQILPPNVIEEVMPLLKKQETDFTNNNAYKLLKTRILKIFGPTQEDPIERALGRVLVGKPSTLLRSLVNDICKQDAADELDCVCCPAVVSTLWKRQLSTSVRAGIAHLTLSKDTFQQTA